MATQAHCAYCFESLVASFERRHPLSLANVEDLWEQYKSSDAVDGVDNSTTPGTKDGDEDSEITVVDGEEPQAARPAAISRLLKRNEDSSKASSSSSLPSTASTNSSREASGSETPASSLSSMSSGSPLPSKRQKREQHPLFVTWNTHNRHGDKSLRGCIGTFTAQDLEDGLHSYALTSAFEDTRFQPIPASLLPSLSNHVTLLTNFSQPTKDPLDWTLGTHGMRISFTVGGKRHGATYLPSVAVEQGWTKEEAVVSLMRKAGWNGSSGNWARIWREGHGELVRYEGEQVGLDYEEFRTWRGWVEANGLGRGK